MRRGSGSGLRLILTYHAVDAGPPPLCVDSPRFRAHVDLLAELADVVTVDTLASTVHTEATSGRPLVALTFDDGFASATDDAVPFLLESGLTATLYCVAGHLGGTNDWPSARAGGFRSTLASASTLRDLAAAGIEIGCHGMRHSPLISTAEAVLRREIVDSRALLEDAVGQGVRTFAYPYGAGPSSGARRLVEQEYAAACTTRLDTIRPGVDPLALPRIDVHYVRDPERLRSLLLGSAGSYLAARGLARRVRRAFATDFDPARVAR